MLGKLIESMERIIGQLQATNDSLLLIARMNMIGFLTLIVLLVFVSIWLANRIRQIEEKLGINEVKPKSGKFHWKELLRWLWAD